MDIGTAIVVVAVLWIGYKVLFEQESEYMNNGKQIINDLITSQSSQRPTPKRGEVYQHFKGNYYIIEDIALDTESESEVVIYRALYGEHKLFSRSLSMFMEVLPSGISRFTKADFLDKGNRVL